MKDLLIGLGLLSCPALVFVVFGTSGVDAFDDGYGRPSAPVVVEEGMAAFVGECARCHGRLAQGTERGPNLIDAEYGPRRRNDDQLRRAIVQGMPASGTYGAMPAARNLSEDRLNRIVTFLREMQRANGIR